MAVEFFNTMMGKKYYEHDVPQITKALNRIADALENQNQSKEMVNGGADGSKTKPHDLSTQEGRDTYVKAISKPNKYTAKRKYDKMGNFNGYYADGGEIFEYKTNQYAKIHTLKELSELRDKLLKTKNLSKAQKENLMAITTAIGIKRNPEYYKDKTYAEGGEIEGIKGENNPREGEFSEDTAKEMTLHFKKVGDKAKGKYKGQDVFVERIEQPNYDREIFVHRLEDGRLLDFTFIQGLNMYSDEDLSDNFDFGARKYGWYQAPNVINEKVWQKSHGKPGSAKEYAAITERVNEMSDKIVQGRDISTKKKPIRE